MTLSTRSFMTPSTCSLWLPYTPQGRGSDGSPVTGVKDRIQLMLKKHSELTDEVNRLEGLVEKQGRELEIMNSNRMGMYDDDFNNNEGNVTQRIVDDEEEQVKQLEDKIKEMQEQVSPTLEWSD